MASGKITVTNPKVLEYLALTSPRTVERIETGDTFVYCVSVDVCKFLEKGGFKWGKDFHLKRLTY